CVGVDLSKNSIKELQNKSKNSNKFKFIVGDVEKIKLNEKFDIILSLEVLEHLLNPEKHIEIIKKHLKKDGILILSTPNKKYLFKDIYKFVRKFKKIEKEQDEDFEHINVISYLELKHLLRKNGFKIIDKRRTSLVFGDYYLDRFFVILLFLDSLFPKKMMYAGNGMVIAAKLK
ncbi:MAG: class I SAM-dependent methyltransferase, partial [Nanoarchaeota archaeon]|nr:class I SAM-dependent methyltransferase [Nanoarchaeota archaeon]